MTENREKKLNGRKKRKAVRVREYVFYVFLRFQKHDFLRFFK